MCGMFFIAGGVFFVAAGHVFIAAACVSCILLIVLYMNISF